MSSVVYKFGGTSVENTKMIKEVAKIIVAHQTRQNHLVVILSATGGTTDKLIELTKIAVGKQDYFDLLDALIKMHADYGQELIDNENHLFKYLEFLDQCKIEINQILSTLELSGSINTTMIDLVSGYGELWSSKLMHYYLMDLGTQNTWVDAREIITIDPQQALPEINWKITKSKFKEMKMKQKVQIIPGYVARTNQGAITTLGRNGSDLTAAIFSVLTDAKQLHIWTDVTGVYSADPRIVEDASILAQMSYLEALEMAYFGAKVLHPASLYPAIEQRVPIFVRSTFLPDLPGTKIHDQISANQQNHMVRGFATIEDIALVSIHGSGMIGVPGISEKMFGALRKEGISVIMISQASSEFSISVAIQESDGRLAKSALERVFDYEIQNNFIQSVTLEEECAILSVVGDNMVNQPGIAAILFNSLSRARINVRMISQGSSERNISVILNQSDIRRGLKTAHAAFYLSHLTLSIGIIGTGLIGSALLEQIREESKRLREKLNIDLRIRGISNSKSMYLDKRIELDNWKTKFAEEKTPLDLEVFEQYINSEELPHAVIIDCTASSEIAEKYIHWLREGIHVITPNKKANSGPIDMYRELKKFIEKGPSTNPLDQATHYFYETTVGAGLPIINTLKDLQNTGDKIEAIEGVLSGTLSYIFNSMDEGESFSSVVSKAKHKGYTEPDPRDDLSGIDVARKMVILAREMNVDLTLDDITVESLIPIELKDLEDVNQFLQELANYDDLMRERIDQATENNLILRYVGRIDRSGTCTVGLKTYPKDHPFCNLRGSENIISFTTKRYKAYPLIVQGPGAGAEVTSAGVFADLLRLANLLGSS